MIFIKACSYIATNSIIWLTVISLNKFSFIAEWRNIWLCYIYRYSKFRYSGIKPLRTSWLGFWLGIALHGEISSRLYVGSVNKSPSKLSWVALLYCFLVSKFVHKSRYVYDKRLWDYRDKSYIFIKSCLQWRKRSFYALAHVNFLFTNLQNSFSWVLDFGSDACVHALLFFILYFYDLMKAA